MGARSALLALGVAGALLLAGCGASEPEPTGEETTTPVAVSQPVALEGFDAIAADGTRETEALDAAPAIFEVERAGGSWPNADWDALALAEPRLVAYLVRVEFEGQVALFEVRADGVPHNLYAYHKAFDSGSIIWTPAEDARGGSVGAQSAGEVRSVSAVESVMRDAFPEDPLTVSIAGYRVAYVADGVQPLVIEVAPDGSVISVSM
ncbi:hypothetical protein [Anaerosoma tenue]|uniref:hypothetical protein n=1 Tax=Anaerosoma tenue TaxID=2933588 RepID=UPI002260E152|nr:hypothetical protein [Anaerosoma tenue]MCK8115308.1 hypothetical protein [Anaerosoma tenue]